MKDLLFGVNIFGRSEIGQSYDTPEDFSRRSRWESPTCTCQSVDRLSYHQKSFLGPILQLLWRIVLTGDSQIASKLDLCLNCRPESQNDTSETPSQENLSAGTSLIFSFIYESKHLWRKKKCIHQAFLFSTDSSPNGEKVDPEQVAQAPHQSEDDGNNLQVRWWLQFTN